MKVTFCLLLSLRTLIQTHSPAHTPGQTDAGSLHTLLFYFGCVDKRRDMPKHGERGGGTFRVTGQSAPSSARTFFRVTHTRDSIDARGRGACVLNINPRRQRRSRGAITGRELLNIAAVFLEVQTFYDWKCRDYTRLQQGGRCVSTWQTRKRLCVFLSYNRDFVFFPKKRFIPSALFQLNSF